ncbi:MAG: helix-turn-helix domain-containing protein [Beduini sp.]|uniref:AlbA family DNA-binding domain-containing protein n=1 Tax=Beduini sp. TaxID=1922300 RepID=UPI0039A24127
MDKKIKYTTNPSLLLIADILELLTNDGGTIYVGMEKDGSVVGLENANLVMREVNMMIINAYPELILSTHTRIEITGGKEIVRIDVLLDGYIEEYVYYDQFYQETKNMFVPIDQFEKAKYKTRAN